MKTRSHFLALSTALVCLLTACGKPPTSNTQAGDVYSGQASQPPPTQKFTEETQRQRTNDMGKILHPETEDETKTCVRFIVLSLMAYHASNKDFPTTEEGLAALSTPPARHQSTWGFGDGDDQRYAPEGMMDMWGRPYVYKRTEAAELPFDVRSLGADGIESADDIVQPDVIRKTMGEFSGLLQSMESSSGAASAPAAIVSGTR